MQPLEVALSYLERSWPVFPCRHEETHDEETGEVFAPKTPFTTNGFKSATKMERIVRRWWSDYPEAMIAVPTGSAIGAWVLDIDIKGDGYSTLAELEAENGTLPPTLACHTPSGGKHYFFKHVEGVRNRGRVGPGIDVRGDGGYVAAAGSVMGDGRAYRWHDPDAPILPAPQWLLDLVVKQAPEPVSGPAPQAHTNHVYVDAAVTAELADLAGTPMGNRNNRLNDASFALGQFVGAGALQESEARSMLQAVARGWGRDYVNCAKTIENGLKAGKLVPRVIPEPDYTANDNTRLFDVSRIIENGLRKGQALAADDEADAENDATTSEDSAEDNSQESAPEENSALTATEFKWIEPSTLPRREFAYGTHFIRKFVSVTVSPGGIGKTSNSIMEGLAMASGRALVGVKPPERLRVWIFNAEDPRDEMDRRIMAACIHYKLARKDIEGHLFIDSGREQELVVARDDKKLGVKIVEPIVEAVVAQILKNRIDVMIVDPFVSTHRVNENDNGSIDVVAKLWAQVADRTNAAIDIVHHLRKIAEREGTVEDARGAVALISAARSARVLNRMTADQAAQVGVGSEDRLQHFSITHGKSNLTPLSSRLDWRRLVSVPLGNGVNAPLGTSKAQDFAPVVTEWTWPTAEEITSEITPEQKEAIKAAVNGGQYKENSTAKNWVGQAISFVLGMDLDDPSGKKRAGIIAKALIKEGVLVRVVEKDLIRRINGNFLKAA